jgi:hypothetical protein
VVSTVRPHTLMNADCRKTKRRGRSTTENTLVTVSKGNGGAGGGFGTKRPGPSGNRHGRRVCNGTRRPTLGELSRPFLREVHMNIHKEYEAGRSLQDIANELGVAKSTVGDFLKQQGVKLRPRGRPRKLEAHDDGERA